MPGTAIADFGATRRLIAAAGIYDFASHHASVLVPVVIDAWRIEDIELLGAEAQQARDRCLAHIAKVAWSPAGSPSSAVNPGCPERLGRPGAGSAGSRRRRWREREPLHRVAQMRALVEPRGSAAAPGSSPDEPARCWPPGAMPGYRS